MTRVALRAGRGKGTRSAALERRRASGGLGGEVAGQRGQVAAGLGGERLACAFFEFVQGEPADGRVLVENLKRDVTLGVGRPKRRFGLAHHCPLG
jgi:hypothetical protein